MADLMWQQGLVNKSVKIEGTSGVGAMTADLRTAHPTMPTRCHAELGRLRTALHLARRSNEQVRFAKPPCLFRVQLTCAQ